LVHNFLLIVTKRADTARAMTTLRARWPFLLAAALAVMAALLTQLWPTGHRDDARADDTPTAAQARPATELAASLPAVPGSTRDTYDTACGTSTPYCIASMSLSARQLATGIQAMLIARGAHSVERLSCDTATEVSSGLGDCYVRLTFRGLAIAVTATNVREPFGVRRPARAFVVVNQQYVFPPKPPLPTWPALRLLPAAWGTPPCTEKAAGGGCLRYGGGLTLRLPLARAVPAVRSALVSWGLAIDDARCVTASAHPGCFVVGAKFLAVGGRDQVKVSVIIRGVDARTSVANITVGS
jgi:hypothetical protein